MTNLRAGKTKRCGLGLFAEQQIGRGRVITEYTGARMSAAECDGHRGKYWYDLGGGWFLDGSARSNLARYVNHSCHPNAEAHVSRRKRVWIRALRDVLPGEEITFDYGPVYRAYFQRIGGCRCSWCYWTVF